MNTPPPTPRFHEAFWFWLKLGLVSFGGPAGQIAIMHRELVERRRWISERRFLHALNYCMLLPGPEAQQLATYLGWLMHRTPGGVMAGGLFVLPSMLMMIGLAWGYVTYAHVPSLAAVFMGIKPAVLAIVVWAAVRVGRRVLHTPWLWAIALASTVAMAVFQVPFPLLVIVAAGVGWAAGRRQPQAFSHPTRAAGGEAPPAVIDDDTPTPAHARFRRGRLLGVVATGFLLWAVPTALLVVLDGAAGLFTQMAWFFTQAALVTFGGAYAVLPYVYQAAVLDYGWVSGPQMMDALALGETTPGPLIMVVTFVAFLSGHQNGLILDSALAAGLLGALVVTWMTFLPSFVFIFAGGPLVESTRDKLGFTAPLAAISAAVTGAIANLAWFFASHVLWRGGSMGLATWDVWATLIAVGAGVLLIGFKRGVIEVLGGCAVIGLMLHFFGVGGF